MTKNILRSVSSETLLVGKELEELFVIFKVGVAVGMSIEFVRASLDFKQGLVLRIVWKLFYISLCESRF